MSTSSRSNPGQLFCFVDPLFTDTATMASRENIVRRYMPAFLRNLVLGTLAVQLIRCAPQLAPPIHSGEPIGIELMNSEPMFRGKPFRVMLDFESSSDLAFVKFDDGGKVALQPEIDHTVAHTGGASLKIPDEMGAPKAFVVKVDSLLPAGSFPNGWSLIGGYFISRHPATIEASYVVDGNKILKRTIVLGPRHWTPVMLDLSLLSDPNTEMKRSGVLRFESLGADSVWCDDIFVLDNTSLLIGAGERPGETWTVRRSGFVTYIEKPGSFRIIVPSPEADSQGWNIMEANELRVRAVSVDGKRFWAIYSDGREYRDGKFFSAFDLPGEMQTAFVEQHESPAELSVPEDLGRVERNAPGDLNNDGYAEMLGSYSLKASGPRFEVTLTPRTAMLVRPVLEIEGLPAGKVVATLQGRLIEKAVRLANGHVLIEVPATVDRPVTLNIRVQ